MSAGTISFASWAEARTLAETCPWAGPRPLSGDEETDRLQLVGRKSDIEEFVRLVRTNSLVRLEAESGVGKTSLVRAGLVPELKRQGYKPFYCNTLVAGGGSSDVDTLLRSALSGQVELGEGSVAEQLHRQFGAVGVLILDQFEELIRYDAKFFSDVSTWIADALQTFDLRIVISLRSEYSHHLRGLERDLNPWVEIAPKILLSIRDDAALCELLGAPFAEGAEGSILAKDVEQRILALWGEHHLGEQATGLLQLQSLLYALHGRRGPDGRIAAEALDDLERLARDRRTVFDVAMAETVQLKMDLCQKALGGAMADPYLLHGTRHVVRRGVRYLSSGGYKVIQEEHELLLRTTEPELAVLRPEKPVADLLTDPGLEEAFRALMRIADSGESDLLTASWEEFAPSELRQAKLQGQPWDLDGHDQTSGPMLGLDPRLVGLEEIRRFAFALQWLKASHLVRMTDTGDDKAMVSLVHDGFGMALEAWAASVVVGPAEEIHRLTAAKGEIFDWRRADAGVWPELDGTRIVNVRWQHGVIRGRFRSVTFVNCDLRGTRFEDCSFEGVIFLNCLMDAVTLTGSRVRGPVPPYEDDYPKGIPPSFEVPVSDDPQALERFARYRGARSWSGEVGTLISHTSGMPAVPASREHLAVFPPTPEGCKPLDGLPARLTLREPTGGLAMYGGRLCSLMVRDCTFPDNGQIGLRMVSGTALDVVECKQGTASIDIFGRTIRGLTITEHTTEAPEQAGRLELSVRDSALAETWLGPGINGSFAADESVLWQLVNLSGRIKATFSKCPAFGLVNIGGTEGVISLDDAFQSKGLADAAAARAKAAPMDYQSDPARAEYERRQLSTPDRVWPQLGVYMADEDL